MVDEQQCRTDLRLHYLWECEKFVKTLELSINGLNLVLKSNKAL